MPGLARQLASGGGAGPDHKRIATGTPITVASSRHEHQDWLVKGAERGGGSSGGACPDHVAGESPRLDDQNKMSGWQ